jgi:DNA (cytosine-5)-methyltransferase 1
MAKKNSHITVTDQFCGAGGSSQGVRLVAREKKLNTGLEVKLAMNHWPLAIETHNTNFPDTDHVCTDISACDPRRYHSTDILITSPECTVHSPAGGGQAKKKMYGNQLHTSGKLMSEIAEERSRATMWDVCRFTEYHRYNIIIVENVVEARTKWVLFDTWLMAMTNLGYDHEIKYINSMHAHPTPQSRDRMYCVFWKKGNKKPNLNHTPVAPCHKCLKTVEAYQWFKPRGKRTNLPENHGKYRTQYLFKCPDCNSVVEPYFYAAFNCIDWSKPGTRIGDRKKPLSPKTEVRCQYGVDKFWDEPSFINVKFSSGVDFRVKPVAGEPLTTQPGDAAVGILNPMIISSRYIQGIGNRVKSSEQALPVQVTDGRESVLTPPPLIIGTQYSKEARGVEKSSLDPLRVQTTITDNALVTPPLILDGGWSEAKPRVDDASKEPISVQDTGQTKGVVMPMLIKNYSGKHNPIAPSEQPMASVTAQDHHGLLNVPLVVNNHGQSMSKPSANELPSQTTHPKSGILTAESFNSFISYFYGGSNVASHITEAMRTVSTKERAMLINQPYVKPRLEDCFYRMLLPNEIQLGMAFDADYVVLGDSKQKVKQLGNAVTPPVMKFLVERCVESLL